ncbi:MAG: transporter [Thiopseudomonas sp.]|nr:transporter [Thiopseudomonas sp.]
MTTGHLKPLLGGVRRSRAAVADITLNPFILSWHRKHLHWVLGLDINAPTGRYDSREARRSIGVNYWALEPLLAVTWLSDDGWEASGKFMYNIKSKNRAYRPMPDAKKLDYHSGQEFHLDYLLGKHVGNWGVGVAGYYLKQTTADRLQGRTVAASPVWSKGRRGQVLAYGPAISYRIKPGVAVSMQWNHESRVRNRLAGDRFTLKRVTPL